MSDAIKDLTEHLASTIKQIDWMGQKIHPVLKKEAKAEDLKKLEKKLGRPVPESYATFLAVANGIDGADILQWSINGTGDATKGESFRGFQQEVVAALRTYDAEDPIADLLKNGHVVGSDFHNEIIIFDPSVAEGEPPLFRISMTGEHQAPFPAFEDLLVHVIAFYEDQLAMFDDSLDFSGDIGGAVGGGDGGGPAGFGSSEAELLKELASLLDGGAGFDGEPEPEPELQISPEMALAARMCEHVIDRLVQADLVELMEGPGSRENLEDYMLRKLMRSTREDQVLDNWIHALGKAREVEELYGTDDELKAVMQAAWNEVAEEQDPEG